MLLAFALMGLVLLVSTYLTPQPPPQPAPKATPKAVPAPEITPPSVEKAPSKRESKAAAKPVAPPPQVVAAKEQITIIETEVFQVQLSNRGGVVNSWILRKYKDSNGKPLDLVNPKSIGKVVMPLGVRFHEDQPSDKLNHGLYQVTKSTDGLSVDFEFSDGHWWAKKSLVFGRDSYVVQLSSEVKEGGSTKPHLVYWRGGFGDSSVLGAAAAQSSVRYDLDQSSLVTLKAEDAKERYQAHRGRFSLAGIADAYFAAVAMPEGGREFEIHTLADPLPTAEDGKDESNAGVAIGGNRVNRFPIFIGPKDMDLMRSISPNLELLVDYGYFSILAKPLFLALNYLNDHYFNNYGWTIVFITVVINFLLVPLKITSLKSMKKMSVIQPQIKAINDKYRGMSMTDPRKQQQNQEVMDLYKKHGVNPMGGCLPIALQLPFFIAFYNVLSSSIELRGANWMWIQDLSRLDPYYVLPISMMISQFVMQKMTPSTSPDPTQQKMMLLMPLFFGFIFLKAASGLVLYWLTGNLVGIAQQVFFNKITPAPVPAAVPAPSKKSRK